MGAPDRTVLSEDECWELLRAHELGRLAWADDGEATILPINYAVDDHTLVFRTAPGSKLEAVIADRVLAFEVDALEGEVGMSVMVRGRGHVLPASEEARIDQVGLRAWLGNDKPVLVTIAPTTVSGRRYELKRPWKSMIRR
ncbi:pyridoxamine 5'-phosphate oxidase family protein [Mariniluteicoccus endophyticus]